MVLTFVVLPIMPSHPESASTVNNHLTNVLKEKEMATHSSVLAWRIPGLVGCRLWGRTESDRTERLHFHFSLSCIGEGNGNPLQCSCLENPRDCGASWAAVYGVAQSRTRLTGLSSGRMVRVIKSNAMIEAGRQRVKLEDAMLLALEMESRTTSKGMQADFRS